MASNTASVKHGMVFTQLVVLALLSVAVHSIHLSGSFNNLLVFGIAFAMAALVLIQYMGLKRHETLILMIFIIPVILFAILVILLIPDIAHQPFSFLEGI